MEKPIKPTAIGNMSREELDAELMKGVESLKSGKSYTADEVDEILAKEFTKTSHTQSGVRTLKIQYFS